MLNIAIIGSGPTGIYTAKYLIAQQIPVCITMFESQAEAGKGTPYHQDWNIKEMLSNIASIEIPPITQTLVEWLENMDDFDLALMGLTRNEIDDRAFYPRIMLGKYFQDELRELTEIARAQQIPFVINVNSAVKDVEAVGGEFKLSVESENGSINHLVFNRVIIATGHVWPDKTEASPGYFTSPWPPSELKSIGNCHVGILGTSLSAIDALTVLAVARGAFRRSSDGVLRYLPEPGTEGFRVSLMSRKGLLPEADFYFPMPYAPLEICTEENIDKLIKSSQSQGLLDKAFVLFKAELVAADPDYAEKTGLAELTLEEYCSEYFREREEHDAFAWAARDLAEAKINQQRQYTTQWRYAILRMHEVVARIVPYLSAEEHQRFNRHFKHIFVDDYATVPHESIERLLALHHAGKLDIMRLGADYKLDPQTQKQGVALTYEDKTMHFPAFIDATGQQALSARDFPFPRLLEQGIIHNAAVRYNDFSKSFKKGLFKVGGIALDRNFHPISDSPYAQKIYCPSIPFMLGHFPFAQGITSSHDMGKIIVENIVATVDGYNDELKSDRVISLSGHHALSNP